MYAVIYDDPKRKRGPSHTLHVDTCADLARAQARGGNVVRLAVEDLVAAMFTARYSGGAVSAGADLGAVDPAPCITEAVPHVVYLDGPGSDGSWDWSCACGEEASGYEPEEVEAAADEHGDLAADSPRPELDAADD